MGRTALDSEAMAIPSSRCNLSRRTALGRNPPPFPNRSKSQSGLPVSTLSKQSDMHVAIPLLEIGKGTTSRGDGPDGSGLGSDGDPVFTVQSVSKDGAGTQSSALPQPVQIAVRLAGLYAEQAERHARSHPPS